MVLIPKGKKDYRGIGLVEVMWKVVAAILNRRLTASITYHDFLHGLWAGCGTGTSTLEAKLPQQLSDLREEVLYVIFLDLHKAYDALERSRCLKILEGYGIGPRVQRLLQTYWRRLTMVARAGRYYVTEFQGKRGVTQGNLLSPTIFNVVVDAVVRHWVTSVIAEAETRGDLGKEGRHQAALFYADNGMFASSDPGWLHGALKTLVGLFDRMGLQTNAGKTVGMVCHPCQAARNLTTEAYGRRVTGVGPTYRERLKGQVACGECVEMLEVGSLSSHLMTQHGRAAGRWRKLISLAVGIGPHIYRMSLPAKGGPRKCPVAGCPGRVATRTEMRVHFVHRNVLDTVVIL